MDKIINLFEQTIEEAYIGKTDTLLEIEKQFEAIRENTKVGQDIAAKPEVQKLNRLVEKQFGMDIFSFRVDQESKLNGYTNIIANKFDISLEIDMKKLIVGSQDSGYRFKKNNNLCIVTTFSSGLLYKENITGEELTAVLLHEIGHNFADCLDEQIRLANRKVIKSYYQYLVMKAAIIFGRKYRKALERNTNEYERKNTQKVNKDSKIRGWLKGLASIKYSFTSFCGEVFRKLLYSKFKAMDYSDKKKVEAAEKKTGIKTNADRKNEVFADKFAAVYGYGLALGTGLYKMDTHKSKADKFIAKVFSDKINENFEMLCNQFFLHDCHPALIQRVNAVVHTLRAELAKEDLDPKVKEVLSKQLDQLESFIKELTTAMKNEDERQAVRKAFYKAVNENSPDALTKELEDEIERELDEGLKKNES